MAWLDVACNNPDNGLFNYEAPMLSIGDAEFECKGAAPRFVELENRRFRIAGKVWMYYSSQGSVGNWCWDRYQLCAGPIPTPSWSLVEFCKWLRRRDLYQLTTGPDDFFEWFNDMDSPAKDFEVHKMIVNCFNFQESPQ